MIMQHFQAEHGQEFLLKLSQHPSQDLQLFVSNFVDKHGSNSPEVFEQLIPYFTSVLHLINRGKVLKERVFAFLERESLNSTEIATKTMDLLNTVSLTIAIGDKAKCIELMGKIVEQHPQIKEQSLLEVEDFEIR